MKFSKSELTNTGINWLRLISYRPLDIEYVRRILTMTCVQLWIFCGLPGRIINRVSMLIRLTIMRREKWYVTIIYILIYYFTDNGQVFQVGLKGSTYSVADLLATQTADPLPMQETATSTTPLIVWRERTAGAPLKCFMSEVGPHREDIIVDVEHGYYVVEPNQSVIFLSQPKSLGMWFSITICWSSSAILSR